MNLEQAKQVLELYAIEHEEFIPTTGSDLIVLDCAHMMTVVGISLDECLSARGTIQGEPISKESLERRRLQFVEKFSPRKKGEA